MPQSEQELAAKIVEYLEGIGGYEIYQEVQCGGPIADIVAVHGAATWIIEVKSSAGLAVLAQAYSWIKYCRANYVSIATPAPARRQQTASTQFRHAIMRDHGIGWMWIHRGSVGEDIPAKFHRTYKQPLRPASIAEYVHDGHKTAAAAGSADGGHWTPFRSTVQSLRRYIDANPGCSISDAVKHIDHHYASPSGARTSLLSWIREGVISGVELRRDGRSWGLYPKEAAANPQPPLA